MNPAAEHLLQFLVIVGFLGSIVGNVIQIVRWNRAQPRQIEPQPLDIRQVREFATRSELEKHIDEDRGAHDTLHARFNSTEKSLREVIEQGNRRVHDRVDAVLAAVSEVRGELKRIEGKR